MIHKPYLLFLCVAAAAWAQTDGPTLKRSDKSEPAGSAQPDPAHPDEAWKDKPVNDWSDADAKQVLSDSPWVKNVTPFVNNSSNTNQSRSGGRGGRGGGISMGGIGIGLPGMGGGRRGGGNPGGQGGGQRRNPNGDSTADQDPAPMLRVVWESALPVREAELRTKDVDAPTVEEKYYGIAVYGVPSRITSGADSKTLAAQYKKDASIKRDNKKDLKPSEVQILRREEGPVILFLFPRSKELTKSDKHLDFDAHIGKLEFTEYFDLEEMVYQNKLEL